MGSAAGVDYLVMELLEGETLASRLRRGALPIPEAFAVSSQIAAALGAAHAKGVVHRDLKPGNVMLTHPGVKVLDFGLAKEAGFGVASLDTQAATATEPLTRAGLLLGTLPYMAPEQPKGKAADVRSDIWALGCVLYEMATGERPFHGESQADLVTAIMSGRAEPPSRKQPLAPVRLDRVVARCLEKEPERRWQSARDVAIELEDLAKDLESRAATSELPLALETAVEKKRRLRRWVPAALASLVLIGAAVVWLISRNAPPAIGTDSPPLGEPAPSAGNERPMIVVLPFENLGPPEQAYFAAGMSGDHQPPREIAELGVISRSSALQYPSGAKGIRQIGDELRVDWVLEGTVLWAGEQVRITQQLIRVADDTQVWSEQYDWAIGVENLFAVQSEIAERVSQELGVSLFAPAKLDATVFTHSMDAYHAYLRGMEALGRAGQMEPELLLAVTMFERAVDLDPGLALAWGQLAERHSELYAYGWDRTPERAEAAKRAVERVVALAPDLPETRRARGAYLYRVEGNFAQANRELELAIRELPNDVSAHTYLSLSLQRQGAWSASTRYLEKAAALDPRDSQVTYHLGYSMMVQREYAKADELFRKTLALAPDDPAADILLGWNTALWKGWEAAGEAIPPEPVGGSIYHSEWCFLVARALRRHDEALAQIERIADPYIETNKIYTRSLLRGQIYEDMGDAERAAASFTSAVEELEARLTDNPGDHRIESALGLAYAGLRRDDEAILHARRATELFTVDQNALLGSVPLIQLAHVYAELGDAEQSLDLVEHILSIPAVFSVHWMEGHPSFDPIRSHSRYRRLVERYRETHPRTPDAGS